jgi:hypothetical protein
MAAMVAFEERKDLDSIAGISMWEVWQYASSDG